MHVAWLPRLLLVALLTGALTSCGGSTTKPRTAAGTELDGDGYTVNLPLGWKEVRPGPKEKVDVAGADPVAVRGVTNRVRVQVTGLQTEVDTAALEGFLRTVMAQVARSMPKPTMLPRTELDGEVALGYSGLTRNRGKQYFTEQLAAGHGSRLYTVTFVFARSIEAKVRDARIAAVLRSWAWD